MEKVRGLQNLAYQLAGRKVRESIKLMEKVRGLQNLAYQPAGRKVRESITVDGEGERLTEPRLPSSAGRKVRESITVDGLSYLPPSRAGRRGPSVSLRTFAYQLGWEEGKRVHPS